MERSGKVFIYSKENTLTKYKKCVIYPLSNLEKKNSGYYMRLFLLTSYCKMNTGQEYIFPLKTVSL